MNSRQIEAEAQKADEYINQLCAPRKMTQAEAVDYLESVASRVEASIAAIKEDMEKQ